MKRFSIVIFSVLVLLFISGCNNTTNGEVGQVPVYQGMTISSSSDALSSSFNDAILTSLNFNYNQDMSIEDAINEEIDTTTSDEVQYFAARNQDVFITVKLENPDSQVILRFTLNGTIYQSYQFQEGSDSENLILKVNAGDISGIKEFTIDEIKYIENVTNETKDAVIDGNQTVKLGVTYETVPSATIDSLDIHATSISFNVNVSDDIRLIEKSGNTLKAYLYDGNDIVRTIDLVVGSNVVVFDKLAIDSEYEYAIATVYDTLDGIGKRVAILNQETIQTEKIMNISVSNQTQSTIEFILDINDGDEVGAISAIELYKGETLVEALTDLSVREFTGLLSNNEYTIKVTYTYDLNDGVGEQTLITTETVTTLAKATPTVVIDNVVPTQTSIGFGITVTDVDQVGAVSAIELYQGETLVEALTDLSVREFTGLLSNNEYTIKVTYTYDLNDGVGSQTLTINQSATTVAMATPTVVIDNVVPTQTSIGFGITVTDVDQVGAISAIELYQGETLVKALTDLSVREFTGLLSNNEYTIKVTYTYDLNDGVGEQSLVISKNIKTLAKATPVVLIENIVPTQDSITFEINVTDVDQVGSIIAIELYKGETLVEALTDLSVREFTGLLSNNEYTIKVTYTYDLNDGIGSQTLTINQTTTTLSKAVPTVEINTVVPTQDSVAFNIDVTDEDLVGTITAIELYQSDTLIEALTDLNLREFTGLLSDNAYTIQVTYTYDLNNGLGEQTVVTTYNIDSVAKAVPTVSMSEILPYVSGIRLNISVTDIDNTITYYKISIYSNDELIEESSDIGNIIFSNIEGDVTYRIFLSYKYNLNDGKEYPLIEQSYDVQSFLYDGLGTNQDPFQIYTASDMQNIMYYPDSNFILMNDVDISLFEWIPLGSSESPFSGVFDGQNFIISGMTITQTYNYVGLFGVNNGVVKNLSLDTVTIDVHGSIDQIVYAGAFVGLNYGPLENLHTLNGEIELDTFFPNKGYLGGIMGGNTFVTTFSLLSNGLSIKGGNQVYTGGIVGFNTGGVTFNAATNNGSISGGEVVGGIVGYSSTFIKIINSYNTGDIISLNNVGGLAGRLSSRSFIVSSYNSGNISGQQIVSGLVAYGDVEISNSHNSGEITGTTYTAGLLGYALGFESSIINSWNSGIIYGDYVVGGLAAFGSLIIIDSHNFSVISGNTNVGGLLGQGSNGSKIYTSFNLGDVNGGVSTGGLVGKMYKVSITINNSYNFGNITGTTYIGGLIGEIEDDAAVITKSYNTGNITGNSIIGGLVGKSSSIYIYNSINFGDVISNTEDAGGIIGIIPTTYDLGEVYIYCTVTYNGEIIDGIQLGTQIFDGEIITIEFFTDTLLWNPDIWDFTGLDIGNEIYPILTEPYE